MRPLIVLTNDDGVYAKGINSIIEVLCEMGDVVVFAPDGPRSGMSSAITSLVPIRYELLREEPGLQVYMCSGTPVDCVKLVVNEVLDRKPDLVVSGINHGGNQAIAVHYSGTMGAAIEGTIFGIPSVGVSLLHSHPDADFRESCRIAKPVIEFALKKGLPKGTFLNLNIPNTPDVKGLKVCKQAVGKWEKEYVRSQDGEGTPVFWLSGEYKPEDPSDELNDVYALDHGYASLVPCNIDVTDYTFLEHLQQVKG